MTKQCSECVYFGQQIEGAKTASQILQGFKQGQGWCARHGIGTKEGGTCRNFWRRGA